MAWGALLMRFPKGVELHEVPKDWKPPAIGTVEEVKGVFEGLFPDQRHILGQTCVDGEGFWIEFDYGTYVPDERPLRVESDEAIESIGIRSNVGTGAMAILKAACEKLDCRMLDCQTGELADFSEATDSSMKEFAEWRDRALGKKPTDAE